MVVVAGMVRKPVKIIAIVWMPARPVRWIVCAMKLPGETSCVCPPVRRMKTARSQISHSPAMKTRGSAFPAKHGNLVFG